MQPTGQATTILERIKRSSDRIARLIANILDFARGRLGGGIPVLKRPDAQLPQALLHVIAELSAIHPERKVDADIHITKPVTCDSGRLAQLLANLLSNALAYGAADQPVTVVACRDNDTFILSVTNKGNPIPAETVEQLFQPFARGAGGERRQQGLGLGLYIASQIAQAHGGTLSVASNPAGTTFTLSMPAGN
jgi:signal transduction histidine kinase